VITPAEREQQERAAFGSSLLLDDGDIVIVDGRLTEIAGVANLEQGLQLRIQTPWSSDPLQVEYGLDATDAFTVGLTRDMAKEVLRLNLVRTIAGDPRVAAVDQVLFDDDPQYLAAHPAAAGTAGDRRTALAEITVTPVPAVRSPGVSTVGAAALAAAAAGDSQASGVVTLLAEVRW
jgi:hypothetical protein